MESALRPREMQARIRAGQSVEDVARAAGVPVERVEPFAAPVIAEREHVAALAQRSSVRRRGETSGHRRLEVALTERLTGRGVDTGGVRWDAARGDDGRWTVTASYSSGEAHREAAFLFDLSARYSVAGNDEARWVLGEQSGLKGPQPGRRRGEREPGPDSPDTEPTLDLSDDLALVRATAEPTEPVESAAPIATPDPGLHLVPTEPDPEPDPEPEAEPEAELEAEPDAEPVAPAEPVADQDRRPAVPTDDAESGYTTLDALLDGPLDGYAEDSVRVYEGLSHGGWEPEIVVDDPGRPLPFDVQPGDEPSDDSSDEEDAGWVRPTASSEPEAVPEFPARPDEGESDDEPDFDKIPDTTGDPDAPAEEDAVPDQPPVQEPGASVTPEPEPEPQPEPASVAKPRPRAKKRASVPSWDEIMFGGPKPG